MNELQNALMESVEALKKIQRKKTTNNRKSIQEVVLQYGREFSPSALPRGFNKAEAQKCFENSAKLCLEDVHLIYVEGFASSSRLLDPVHHAWIVKKGATSAIDVTSDEFDLYFGIPIKTEHLKALWTGDTSSASLLDDWRNGWPFLKKSQEEILKLIEVI